MHPIKSAAGKLLPLVIAASLLLALSLACSGGDPTADPTPEDIDAIIAEAEAGSTPAPTPPPEPTPSLAERDEAIAAAVAAILADATPGPSPAPAGSTPTPGPTSTPVPDSTLTPEEQAEMDRINAEAEALSEAVNLALNQLYNGRYAGDKARAIEYAVSVTGVDADAVARTLDEVLTQIPPPPVVTLIDETLEKAVTLALEYLIQSPLDEAGAYAHAASMTGADPNAVGAIVQQVIADLSKFPYLDIQTMMTAVNAVSEARALAGAKAAAEQAANVMPTPTPTSIPPPAPSYEDWNDHEWLAEPKPWWRDSNPYDCDPPPNPDSPWTAADMPDLGGQDPLSLIRYFGNGSYVRYGLMGFEGCTPMSKYSHRTHLDAPADPTYYSLGNLEIAVDIARVPPDAPEWPRDDGSRVEMSMTEAVDALNDNVAAYFRKISQGKLQMTFVAGVDFQASGQGTPQEAEDQWMTLIGIVGCDPDNPDAPGCRWGRPGALNRIFLNDVQAYSGGAAWNGYAELGLVTLKNAVMTTLLHEIGHSWMFWPHSYVELYWKPNPGSSYQKPNFYSNRHDFMSALTFARPSGWHQDMPATLAINRYAAGWIDPEDVALHLSDEATYRLARPRESGYQFLVVHSGRSGAFTTLEVLDERNAVYRDAEALVHDPASPGQRRPLRYEGVLVSRYDQTAGTGINARSGPALYNSDNPDYKSDVGYGRDDFSVIADGESRSIGGGLTVSVAKNPDGSYDVTVSGGMMAEYEPWCVPIWFSGEYDTGCALEDFNFGAN